jgi:hypothetical protein
MGDLLGFPVSQATRYTAVMTTWPAASGQQAKSTSDEMIAPGG